MKNVLTLLIAALFAICGLSAQAESFELTATTNSDSHWSLLQKYANKNLAILQKLDSDGQSVQQAIANSPVHKMRMRNGEVSSYSVGIIDFKVSGNRTVFKLEKLVRNGKEVPLPTWLVKQQARIMPFELQPIQPAPEPVAEEVAPVIVETEKNLKLEAAAKDYPTMFPENPLDIVEQGLEIADAKSHSDQSIPSEQDMLDLADPFTPAASPEATTEVQAAEVQPDPVTAPTTPADHSIAAIEPELPTKDEVSYVPSSIREPGPEEEAVSEDTIALQDSLYAYPQPSSLDSLWTLGILGLGAIIAVIGFALWLLIARNPAPRDGETPILPSVSNDGEKKGPNFRSTERPTPKPPPASEEEIEKAKANVVRVSRPISKINKRHVLGEAIAAQKKEVERLVDTFKRISQTYSKESQVYIAAENSLKRARENLIHLEEEFAALQTTLLRMKRLYR